MEFFSLVQKHPALEYIRWWNLFWDVYIYTKFMGAEQSHHLVDPSAFHRNFSHEHGISMWEQTPPKNREYYDGTRFFKVGKDKYSCYARGYFYGWTEQEEQKTTSAESEDFVLLQSELSAIEGKKAALVAKAKQTMSDNGNTCAPTLVRSNLPV